MFIVIENGVCYWCYTGIMEKKTETTIYGFGLKVWVIVPPKLIEYGVDRDLIIILGNSIFHGTASFLGREGCAGS